MNDLFFDEAPTRVTGTIDTIRFHTVHEWWGETPGTTETEYEIWAVREDGEPMYSVFADQNWQIERVIQFTDCEGMAANVHDPKVIQSLSLLLQSHQPQLIADCNQWLAENEV